jgi:protein-tyrosine phosphatase
VESTRQNLRRLLLVGISLFVDLTQAGEHGIEPYAPTLHGEATALERLVQYRRVPIPDMQTPTPEEMIGILDTVDAGLSAGRMVYVHCLAGLGRTGTVVGCHLARHGLDGTQALEEIVRLRKGAARSWDRSPVTEAQRAMVRGWPVGT